MVGDGHGIFSGHDPSPKRIDRLLRIHQFLGPQGILIPYSDKTGGSTGIVLGVLGDSTAILLCILGMVRDVH